MGPTVIEISDSDSDDEITYLGSSYTGGSQGHGRQFLRIPRDTSLFRSRFRPDDPEVRTPYALQRVASLYETGRFAYNCRTPDFHVRQSRIYIDTSDVIPGTNAPHNRIAAKAGTTATIQTQVHVLPEHDTTQQEWLRKLGALIAAVMFGKPARPRNKYERPFLLARFPDGMVFHRRVKTHSDKPETRMKPRSDAYLRGASGVEFRSPQEFARHAMWLMDGKPEDASGHSLCICKYCDRVDDPDRPGNSTPSPQRPITKDLYSLAGYSSATEAEASSRETSMEVDEEALWFGDDMAEEKRYCV